MPPTYFAICWPIWPEEPERRPGSTTIWHMGQIQDEESVSVCVVTDEPDRWSSWTTILPYVRCIYTDFNAVVIRSCVAICDSNRFVHVSGMLVKLLKTIRWIGLTEHGRTSDHMTVLL